MSVRGQRQACTKILALEMEEPGAKPSRASQSRRTLPHALAAEETVRRDRLPTASADASDRPRGRRLHPRLVAATSAPGKAVKSGRTSVALAERRERRLLKLEPERKLDIASGAAGASTDTRFSRRTWSGIRG